MFSPRHVDIAPCSRHRKNRKRPIKAIKTTVGQFPREKNEPRFANQLFTFRPINLENEDVQLKFLAGRDFRGPAKNGAKWTPNRRPYFSSAASKNA